MKVKIGVKITVGFVVMLALIGILGVVSFLSLAKSGHNLDSIQTSSQRLILAMQIQNSFTEGAASATRFIAYGDAQNYKQVEKALSETVVLQYQFVDIVEEDKRADAQKIIRDTAKYSDIIMNDLAPLVRAYHSELAAGNAEKAQALKGEVSLMADRMVPIGDQVATVMKAVVTENKTVVDDSIRLSQWYTQQANTIGLIVCAVAFVVGLVLSIGLTRAIINPLTQMVDGANRFAEGDLTNPIVVKSRDELGQLATAMNAMQDSIKIIVQSIHHLSRQVAGSAQELTAIVDHSAAAADQVAGSISEVHQNSASQMTAVNEALSIVEEMSSGIAQIAVNTDQMSDMSRETAAAAQNGVQSISSVTTQMANIERTVLGLSNVVVRLGEHSQEIGQIVDTIAGIASQTNLLALNAAIEAARAGDQGRGFAVVADEVRKLAHQSQEAAKQIAFLIHQIQQETGQAVNAMEEGTKEVKKGSQVVDDAGQSFTRIVELINQVANQVQEISSAIHHMSGGSQKIVMAVRAIDSTGKDITNQTEMIAAATDEEAASMAQITDASQTLSRMAEELQSAVNKFKVQ